MLKEFRALAPAVGGIVPVIAIIAQVTAKSRTQAHRRADKGSRASMTCYAGTGTGERKLSRFRPLSAPAGFRPRPRDDDPRIAECSSRSGSKPLLRYLTCPRPVLWPPTLPIRKPLGRPILIDLTAGQRPKLQRKWKCRIECAMWPQLYIFSGQAEFPI